MRVPLLLVFLPLIALSCTKDSLERYQDLMQDLIELHLDSAKALDRSSSGKEATAILERFAEKARAASLQAAEFAKRSPELRPENRLKVPEKVIRLTLELKAAQETFLKSLAFSSPKFLLDLDYGRALKRTHAAAEAVRGGLSGLAR